MSARSIPRALRRLQRLLLLVGLTAGAARAAEPVDPDEALGDEDPLAGVVRPQPASVEDAHSPRALIHLERRDKGDRKVRLPPTRVELRIPIRQGIDVLPYTALGTQLTRRGRFTLDADVGIAPGRQIQMAGPWRIQAAAGGMLYPLVEFGTWLSAGPALGIEYRWWRQQGTPIGSSWMPQIGVRANSMLIGARKWGFVVGAGATADLGRTRFVRENQEIVDLVPFEGSLSMRFVFGHGRDRREVAR